MPRLLFVHPHPDDEAIACGGSIARHTAAGDDVLVVTCTGGEVGENQSGIDLGGRSMGEVRREEMADAIVALGSPRHAWLGYRDSGMVDTDDNAHPESFHAAPLADAAARLAASIREFRPDVVISDDANGTYGHPDHVKAHVVTNVAIELAADPNAPIDGEPHVVAKRYVHALSRRRMWEAHEFLTGAGLASPFGDGELSGPEDLPFGIPDEEITTEVEVADVFAAKQAAMAAHRSQIGPDSFFLNLPEEVASQAFALEQYVLVDGASGAPDGQRETSLTAGL